MNLWKDLDKIITPFKQSPVKILMLDFDGTLTPIVKSPNQVKLSKTMRNLLIKLTKKEGFYLAILSGRNLKDLKKRVNLQNVIYAGNHGLEGEIFGEKYLFPVSIKMRWALGKIQKQLHQITGKFKGAFIENKGLTLSFHYRLVDRRRAPEIKLLINRTLKPYIMDGAVSLLAGQEVIDITPNVNWNKGDFAVLVTKKITDRMKTHPAAIVIGDDVTDEDVFRKFKKAITIKVGQSNGSEAKYNFNNIKEVFEFLKWIKVNI